MSKINLAFLLVVALFIGISPSIQAQTFGGCNFGYADLTSCTLHYTNPPNPDINIPWNMAVGTCSSGSAPSSPYALTSVTIDGVIYTVPFTGIITPYGKVSITPTGMSILP